MQKGALRLNESQEAALIRRCQAGDKEAFSTLVERYRSVLFGTAYLMVQDRGLAEDAVQEALIKIWKNLPAFQLKSSLKTWLVRIVVNEVKQHFRKKQVPTVPLEQAFEVADDFDKAETAMIRNEERHNLKRILRMLPQEQREAVVLRYFSELTVPEIAVVTGQREGTIKSRLSRALSHLLEILRSDIAWEGGR
ncbi:MAG TPA: sigma-70 family RNA polymerase sigma factor [Chloroflexi bacterium]|nr:sigma-70 family RNA polymerase sigma factor [Chloroflexota bacterium]